MAAVLRTAIAGYPRREGKVRDIYDLGDHLLIVATDRISAFDWVLPTPIPDKGRILTQLSLFWFEFLGVPHHVLATDLADLPPECAAHADQLRGRSMLVRKTEVVPIECVARGYLAGSGWKEYQQSQSVCSLPLPAGLLQADRLPRTLFTPATKAQTGHDENISFAEMSERIGADLADDLRQRTLAIYERAAAHAESRGILLADTKFEFGRLPTGEVILIDEVLTPDSSRYWPKDRYQPGQSPPSFDKQFVRDWLETTTWDKNSPPPELPPEIVGQTREKYLEALRRLSGRDLD
ncbi:MAG TPA: phosphoribosylaminoimidazolesuccinocarboxamide synthase [Gemmatales bacterium]|nr:phosphoribosylaminoimidazolesuccinocarboxamide synthase [Gemmatales bacterium]HMP60857.1 phosphoribosylaminoimidazolesuccinocarboxamide synthase [Gemmatales bacterium]